MELQVYQHDALVHQARWETGSLAIGRAADNGLILRDPDVSGHHAVLFREGQQARIRDLGSTNGLFRNGDRIVESAIEVGDLLRVGGLVIKVAGPAARVGESWVIRAVGHPVAHRVESGASLDAEPEAVLFVEAGEVWLDRGAGPQRLEPRSEFLLDGEPWVLEPDSTLTPTVQRDAVFPYRLDVDLHGNEARLEAEGLTAARFRAASRVALLFVLANRRGEWVDDQQLGTGVWGRDWSRQGANNLNVLLHRVRKQAHQQGFDKRFLDRRRGAVRLLVAEAHAHG